jgi:hypothetical protein
MSSWLDGYRLRDDFDDVRAFVMFVGQPRTGHSIVGALLDAHPNALIAHELDALKYVGAGYDRRRLFALLVRAERERIAAGHLSSTGYQYLVEGQWQGRYEHLQVIGDKKGGRSTMRLGEDIGLLDRLRATVGVDVYVVQVVRNPFDVIATMQRRAPKRELSDVVDLFFDLADTVDVVRRRVDPDRFHELHHDTLITDPRTTLGELCQFLTLPAPPDYLDACSAIIYDAPSRTRGDVAWTPELIERVAVRAAAHPSLEHYRFDAEATSAEPHAEPQSMRNQAS